MLLQLEKKYLILLTHLVRAQAPFSLQQLIRLGFAATGEPSRTIGPYQGTGQTYNLTDEALGFTGYRPVTVDPARSLDFKMSGYQRGIRDARREFNSKLLRGDPISPQDVVDRYIIANKAKWEEMKEMSRDLTAGMILGTSQNDIMNVLGRISRKDGAALLTNQFIPFTISENVQQVFEDNARKLGTENPYRVAERALQSLAQTMSGIPLSSSEWPDLTDIFDFRPQKESFFNMGQQAPGDTTGFNPQVYTRPSLTLNNQGLDSRINPLYYPQRTRDCTETKSKDNMTPKSVRENIISLQGHITGLKKDVASIKNNHLKHMSLRIRDLGGKIDKIYWVLLAMVGTIALQLFQHFLA